MKISQIEKMAGPDPDSIDIRDIFQTFWRRIGLFLSAVILVTSLVTLITLQVKPTYSAAASVLLDLKEKDATDLNAVLSGAPPDSAQVDTEVEIIKSLTLSQKVVAKLNLVDDPEFNVRLREVSGIAKFKAWVKSLLPQPLDDEAEQDIPVSLETERVARAVLSNLFVYRQGNTYVINVGFESHSPDKAALVANTFGDLYLLEQLDAKFDATSRANGWLNDRLEVLRAETRTAENAVEVYRGQSGLLSAQGSSLTEQQISDLNAQLIIQTADYNESVARLESVKGKVARGDAADTIGEVLASAVIQALRRQQSEVAGRRAELSSRYGPRHPDVMKVERESADVQAQIDQEIRRIVSNLESEVGIARQKVRSIETGLNRLRGELSSNNRSLIRLRELERDAEANRSLYENFLERFKENDDQETITDADARILSKAVIPREQSAPNTLLNMLLGLVLGIVSGLGLVILAEMLDNGLSTGADVERDIGIPFIASIPKLGDTWVDALRRLAGKHKVPGDFIAENPLSMFAESFRTLRSTLLLSGVGKGPKVVAITSALPGEGKTTVVQSLGRLSAMSGSKVVIVDCDLRQRQLSKLSDKQPKAGLIKFLKGEAKIKDLTIRDSKTDCDYILTSENEYTNKDLFGTPEFANLLKSLGRKYDLVILDTAPVLLVAETRGIANLSDAVVMTTKWRKTKTDAVKTATDILTNVNANVIGLVLSQVNMRTRKKYGLGDYSYYARQYGKYYANPTEEAELLDEIA